MIRNLIVDLFLRFVKNCIRPYSLFLFNRLAMYGHLFMEVVTNGNLRTSCKLTKLQT